MSRLSLVLSLLSLPAAADRPRVVVVPFAAGEGASEKATQKFSTLVSAELKSRADAVEWVAAPFTKPPPEKVVKKVPAPEALAALESGRKAFDDLRFSDAIVQLKKGVELMLADPVTADFEAIRDALVKIAASDFRIGEEREAKNALSDLARLAPEHTLPAGYPPVFQREFEKALKRLDKQPRQKVIIEGPSNATAFFDGRDLGTVPVTVEAVPVGAHSIRVDGTRGERFGQTIEVKNAPIRVKATFGAAAERAPVTALPNPNIGANVDDETGLRLAASCRAAQADFALFGVVYRISDTQLQAGTALYAAKKSGFVRLIPVSFDVEVLTANTESFRLVDEVLKRVASTGQLASPPFSLVAGKAQVASALGPVGDAEADLRVVTPASRKMAPVVVPKASVLTTPSDVLDNPPAPVPEAKPVPTWVWVVVGSAVAVGAGVGGYFGIREVTRPVTGTVNASW